MTSRSATITLTTGSNPNLSLATPYSFTITQSALTPSNITWKVKWNGFSDSDTWGAFNGTPSGSSINYFITNIDTMTMVYKASEGAIVNDASGPGQQIRVKPGGLYGSIKIIQVIVGE